ncbi:hypothetical protein NDA11_004715 [Ustilago hordei]|nr:hypothetical protein NDA11_004715 [Ustilago hordei]KAJ1602574.1 hypothetical protein NDA14_006693 [Ustilago hordei]
MLGRTNDCQTQSAKEVDGQSLSVEHLQLMVMSQCHDGIMARHVGWDTTIRAAQRHYWWPNMAAWIANYVASCPVCARYKAPHHCLYGLLQLLATLDRPWGSILLDFIEGLPLLKGYDSILVIVNRLTKYAILAPTHKTVMVEQTAMLLWRYLVRHFGYPDHMVSDWGRQFIPKAWKEFAEGIGTKHSLSTAYHPQMYGQTKGSTKWWSSTCKWVNDPGCLKYMVDGEECCKYLQEQIREAQHQTVEHYNWKHKDIKFKVGNLVYINCQNWKTRQPMPKLDTRTSSLPQWSTQPVILPLPDEELEFEVEALIGKHIHNQATKYKVLWRGYPEEAASWEPMTNLNCPNLIQEYEVLGETRLDQHKKSVVDEQYDRPTHSSEQTSPGLLPPATVRIFHAQMSRNVMFAVTQPSEVSGVSCLKPEICNRNASITDPVEICHRVLSITVLVKVLTDHCGHSVQR